MRDKPISPRVDVVIGDGKDARIITVAKSAADRWPDVYRPATTSKGNLTAEAKRADDLRDVDPDPITSPDDLPSAADPAPAPAVTATTAGTSGVTTEGVTS
jgi:hypothetical protein